MKALDITPAQAAIIADVAHHWSVYEDLPNWAPRGKAFGEWLAGYLNTLAPADPQHKAPERCLASDPWTGYGCELPQGHDGQHSIYGGDL